MCRLDVNNARCMPQRLPLGAFVDDYLWPPMHRPNAHACPARSLARRGFFFVFLVSNFFSLCLWSIVCPGRPCVCGAWPSVSLGPFSSFSSAALPSSLSFSLFSSLPLPLSLPFISFLSPCFHLHSIPPTPSSLPSFILLISLYYPYLLISNCPRAPFFSLPCLVSVPQWPTTWSSCPSLLRP